MIMSDVLTPAFTGKKLELHYKKQLRENKQNACKNVIAGMRSIISQSSKAAIENATVDVMSYDPLLIREVLLYQFPKEFRAEVFEENIDGLSSEAVGIRCALVAAVKVTKFSFQEETITKTSLKSLLDLFSKFLFFPKKTKNQLYPFIEQLMEFCDKLKSENLDTNEIFCLQRIIEDHKPKLSGDDAPSCPEDLYCLLAGKLQQAKILKQLQRINGQITRTFEECMAEYIFNEFLPYFVVMFPDTVNQLFFARDTKGLQDFINERHTNAICLPDPLYAPDGIVTPRGVKKFLAQVRDWFIVLTTWLPNPNFELSMGTVPLNRTSSQDQIYWPAMIKDLFSQIISSRLLILNAIQQRVSFHGGQGPSENLDTLITILSQLEQGKNTESVDGRVLKGFEEQCLVSPEMSLSYHLIFDAIVTVIAKQLVLRTINTINKELSKKYGRLDDNIGAETQTFNKRINTVVHNNVKELIKNTLPYKLKRLPVADFMKFIEATYERQIDLTAPNKMESELSHDASNNETAFFLNESTSLLQQAAHHDRVNYYLTTTVQPKNIFCCIKTFHTILQAPFLTEKELLLLILVWNGRHLLAEVLQPEIRFSPSDFAEKIAERFFTLCQLKTMQGIEFGTSHTKTSTIENEYITQKIFSSIHKSPTLLASYCQHLLKKDDKNAIDDVSLNFLAKNFKDIKNVIKNSEDLTKIRHLCRPIWNAKITALQKKLMPSVGFFHASGSGKQPTDIELKVINPSVNADTIKVDTIRSQCRQILSQADTVLGVTKSWGLHLFSHTKKSSRHVEWDFSLEDATSIEAIYEYLSESLQSVNTTSNTKKMKIALEECILLIAQEQPELVDFSALNL